MPLRRDPPLAPPLRETGPARALVITADDFGAASAVNVAVEQAHAHGVLTAASLMVGGAAAADAVARARRLPALRVGLHLVLVEGWPISDPAAVPDLVGRDGRFRNDMVRLGLDIFARPSVRRQLAAEIRAQFAAFARTGLSLDHVNGHKHFHLHPTVAKLVAAVGGDFGEPAVRLPREPRAVLAAADPAAAPPVADVTAPWSELAQRRLRRQGLRTPDQVFGLRWSGAMTAPRLAGLIRHLPEGLSEIYLHPAIRNDYCGAAAGYRYVEEFRALLDPDVMAAAHRPGLVLGGFADFPDRGRSAARVRA